MLAGLAGGGAACFMVTEYGIALRFTGGGITLPHMAKLAFLPDIRHVLVASPFCRIYEDGSFGALHNEPDPLILLSTQDTS